MFEFHAHGVGSITLSRRLAKFFFNLDLKPISFAGGTETVSSEVRGLERL
jgi:hypothetical protein